MVQPVAPVARQGSRWIVTGLLALLLTAPAWAEPAAIAPSGGPRERAESSFQTFARDWVQDMRRREVRARKAGQDHTGPGAEWRVELRPTGKSRTPYVGILHYTENRMRCSGAGSCQRVGSSGISEFFRFQNGKWVY